MQINKAILKITCAVSAEQAYCEHLTKETWVNIILVVYFINGMFNSRLVTNQSALVIRMSEHIIMGSFQG